MHRLVVLIICLVCQLSFAQKLTKEIAWAIKYGHTEYLDDWIAAEDINACLEVGSSKTYNYLSISIKLKSLKSLAYFVERGANIEAVCEVKTPLMFAAKYGQLKMIQFLLEKGANPRIKIRGYSALHYARKFKQYDSYRWLRNHTSN
ncbi:MAG: ankyrin repeat domain-containing protein [Flavobacteriaceae bacterium]|nr:ankyrin repeat domain-containing protein [Flavobacteriaceae bacterium]MDH3796290.1 ankyrin repeat domain-containing protein [Flavobacteriaceae bacterium]